MSAEKQKTEQELVNESENLPEDTDVSLADYQSPVSDFDNDNDKAPGQNQDLVPSEDETQGQETQKKKPKKKLIYLIFIAIFIILIAASAITVLVHVNNQKRFLGHGLMLEVGPIISKIGPHQTLNVTLNISCKSSACEKEIIEQDLKIKSKLKTKLDTPYCEKIILRKNFIELKELIKNELNKTLTKSQINDLYFSKIVVY